MLQYTLQLDLHRREQELQPSLVLYGNLRHPSQNAQVLPPQAWAACHHRLSQYSHATLPVRALRSSVGFSQVLHRLAAAQWAQRGLMFVDEMPHALWSGLGIFAERPADGLANEELFVAHIRLDTGEEQ